MGLGGRYFLDCSGEMEAVSRLERQASSAVYAPAGTALGPAKLTFGDDHSAALEFRDVRIPAGAVINQPPQPRHFRTIEGGRNNVSGRLIAKDTQSL